MKAILKSHFYADTISQGFFYAFNHLQYPLTELNTSQNVPLESLGNVEKILKGSMDSIPSPSVKIQIIGGKVYLR